MAKRIAVFASGGGSLLAAMIERKVPIALVLADKPCRALEIAHAAGIRTILIDRRAPEYGWRPGVGEGWRRKEFTLAIAKVLDECAIDLVAMAGFFTILHEVIFERYRGRILNIHPAFLPNFPGEHAVRDTLAAGTEMTGSTVHIATETLDDATYIVARSDAVQVLPDDDEDSLWERIKVEERRLYPQVLHDILAGTIDLKKIMAAA